VADFGQPPVTDGAVAPSDHRFPCPACGADLRFQPGTTAMKCQHCGHEEPIPEIRGGLIEHDLREAARLPPAAMEETRVARCESCGAEIEFDADVHSKECPFCASPIVTDTGLHRHIKPQAQLPFLITEEEARAAMNKWLGRLWFAPSDLVRFARAERRLQGIYVPYWTYDAETETEYTGQRGTIYYEVENVAVMVGGKRQMSKQQVAKMRWQGVRGRVAREFDDVLVLGATSLPQRFTDAIAPWDLTALSAYEPRYLAGFRAEGYTVPVEEGYGRAREIMNAAIAGDVRRDIGGDGQRIGKMDTKVGRLTFKHVLLPVWMAAYRYGGKSYRFAINGRTGQVSGERPYSWIKIGLMVALMFLAAIAVAALQVAGQ
jgi:predicted RNA-binding Zn-ribbon protein involved in translation (DUF1610 family)